MAEVSALLFKLLIPVRKRSRVTLISEAPRKFGLSLYLEQAERDVVLSTELSSTCRGWPRSTGNGFPHGVAVEVRVFHLLILSKLAFARS